MELEVVACPMCGMPAEITPYGLLDSTVGPIEHVRVRCIEPSHLYLMPSGSLTRL